jgi:hypothetical protein
MMCLVARTVGERILRRHPVRPQVEGETDVREKHGAGVSVVLAFTR